METALTQGGRGRRPAFDVGCKEVITVNGAHPGVILLGGRRYKTYRGMGSIEASIDPMPR